MLEKIKNSLSLLLFSSTQSSLRPSTSLDYFFHQGNCTVFLSQFTLLMNFKKITFPENNHHISGLKCRKTLWSTENSHQICEKLYLWFFLSVKLHLTIYLCPAMWLSFRFSLRCKNNPETWRQNKFGFLRNNWKSSF